MADDEIAEWKKLATYDQVVPFFENLKLIRDIILHKFYNKGTTCELEVSKNGIREFTKRTPAFNGGRCHFQKVLDFGQEICDRAKRTLTHARLRSRRFSGGRHDDERCGENCNRRH